MTPTTAAVIAASAPESLRLARSCSTNGAPAKIHSMDGVNVTHVVIAAPIIPAATGANGAASRNAGKEADELRHQDQRPRCRFGQAEAVHHLGRGHPAMGLDRLLRHIGEQRIGAAEAHHRKLGEKHADAHQHMARAEASTAARRRAPTRRAARRRAAISACRQRSGAGRDQRCDVVLEPEQCGRGCATTKPITAAAIDDQRKRQRKEENADEGRRRDTEQQRGLERRACRCGSALRPRSPARPP